MSDRLSGVATFVATVEAGGFAAAAKRLGLTRSAIGKAIARLESRLGARLFQRTTRSQSLTDDGQMFYERCLRALTEIEAAEAAIESGLGETAGRLRISAPVLFGRRCVAPILVDLAREHPQLKLEISFADRRVDMIEEGYDLVVRFGPFPDRAGLMSRCVARQSMTVCASPAYLKAHGWPRSPAALIEYETIAFVRDGKPMPWLFPREGRRPHEPAIRSRLSFDDFEAIADAAIAGMGLAWLPSWLIADRLKSGELECVLERTPSLVQEINVLWPQSRNLPMRVRAAIDALAARLPRASQWDGSVRSFVHAGQEA